jgi:uncharacterized protein (DUF433 family)
MILIEENDLAQLPIMAGPDIVSGAPVFRGTRVPVEALIGNLEAGLTLNEFLENFPTVTREQALQVLEFYRLTLSR